MRRYFLVWFLVLSSAFGEPSLLSKRNLQQYYRPINEPDTPRGLVVPELFSLLLPGTDQWVEGRFSHALLYSTVALGGLGLRVGARDNLDHRYKDFGTEIYLLAGGLSLFEAFRTAVYTRRSLNQFSFLKVEETPTQLVLAPFDYRYLKRLTTLAPLFAGGIYYFLIAPKGGEEGRLSFGDVFYATGNGLMTGVAEECVFRGWLYPVLRNSGESQDFALWAQAGAYGLAHGIRFEHFVTAFLFGLYSGWLMDENDGSIGEGIFIHAWWDVMAFMSDYATHRGHAFLRIPPLYIRF
jgi:membrane protease YdiL (CAAX protease family)